MRQDSAWFGPGSSTDSPSQAYTATGPLLTHSSYDTIRFCEGRFVKGLYHCIFWLFNKRTYRRVPLVKLVGKIRRSLPESPQCMPTPKIPAKDNGIRLLQLVVALANRWRSPQGQLLYVESPVCSVAASRRPRFYVHCPEQ